MACSASIRSIFGTFGIRRASDLFIVNCSVDFGLTILKDLCKNLVVCCLY